MENYCIILEDKIYSQRAPNSKFIEFTLDNIKTKTYEDLPNEIIEIIKLNEDLQQNPSKYLKYKFIKNGVEIVEIKTDEVPFIKIPEFIDGSPVIKLGSRITNFNDLKIKQIQLPDTIKEFSEATFENSNVEYINAPKKLTIIPSLCFKYSKIKTFDCSNIEKIENQGFANCSQLVKIDLPKVKKIGSEAFVYCKKLNEVNLSNYITEIPPYAFYGAKKLKKIKLPKNINKVCVYGFYNSGLEEIEFNDKLTEIKGKSFQFTKLKRIKLPEELLTIEEGAFFCCEDLEEIITNNKLKLIKKEAFSDTKIKNIYLSNDIIYEKDSFPSDTHIIINKEEAIDR